MPGGIVHEPRDMEGYLKWWTERNSRPGFHGPATVEGISLMVRKGVFSPDPSVTYSTTALLHALPDLRGKTVLDVGTGSGIVAIYAARHGAERITAVDLQPEAILNAKANIESVGVSGRVDAFESDVFDSVSGTYDVIAANLPFMVLTYVLNHIATETYRRFFDDLPNHMHRDSRAYLTFASFGDIDTLKLMIAESPFRASTIATQKDGCIWYVFELS